MGYDSGECILCYCNYGANVVTGGTGYNICSSCFLKLCPRGLQGRACCAAYVQLVPDGTCDFCDCEDLCLYHVAVCDRCATELLPAEKIGKTTYVDHIVCDGECSCPECPQRDDSIRECFMVSEIRSGDQIPAGDRAPSASE